MDTASVLVILGALLFATLLLVFAVAAARHRAAATSDEGAGDGSGAFVAYIDSGSAHASIDSSCAASHGVDCGSPGH